MSPQITTSLTIHVWDDGSVDLGQVWLPAAGAYGPAGSEVRRRLTPDTAADLLLVLLDEAARR